MSLDNSMSSLLKENADRIAELERQNASLAAEVERLSAQVPQGITEETLEAIWKHGFDAENTNDRERCDDLICARNLIEESAQPSVSALVEALERIVAWPDGGNQYGQANIKIFAAEALVAYREGGDV